MNTQAKHSPRLFKADKYISHLCGQIRAIHYPQIVWHGEAELAARPAAEARVLREVQAKMVKARYAEALDLLERSGPNATASANTRISLLLALGRVDDAIASLGRRADADDATILRSPRLSRRSRSRATRTTNGFNSR